MFNYPRAKLDGLSDEEVITTLSEKLGFRLDDARNDGLANDVILPFLLSEHSRPKNPLDAVRKGFEYVAQEEFLPSRESIKDSPKRSMLQIATLPTRLMEATVKIPSTFMEPKERSKIPLGKLASFMAKRGMSPMHQAAGVNVAKSLAGKIGAVAEDQESIVKPPLDDPQYLAESALAIVAFPGLVVGGVSEHLARTTDEEPSVPKETLLEIGAEWVEPYWRAIKTKSPTPIVEKLWHDPIGFAFDMATFAAPLYAGKAVGRKIDIRQKMIERQSFVDKVKKLDQHTKEFQLTPEAYDTRLKQIAEVHNIPFEFLEQSRQLIYDGMNVDLFPGAQPYFLRSAVERARPVLTDLGKVIEHSAEGLKPGTARAMADFYLEQSAVRAAELAKRIAAVELHTPVPNNQLSGGAVGYTTTGDINLYAGSVFRGVDTGPVQRALKVEPHKDISVVRYETATPLKWFQEADAGRSGVLTDHILRTTRDLTTAADTYHGKALGQLEGILEKFRITSARSEARVWELLDGQHPKGTRPNELAAAVAIRPWYDALRSDANTLRARRGDDMIPHRTDYVTYAAERSMLEELLGAPRDKLQRPDIMMPKKVFTGYEKARSAPYGSYVKDKNLRRVLGDYSRKIAEDIFITDAIRNNRAVAAVARDFDMPNFAHAVESWTGRLTRVPHPVTAFVERTPLRYPARVQRHLRNNLMNAVFPLNIGFNLGLQVTSHAMLAPRVGFTAMGGAIPLLFSPRHRQLVKEGYTYHQKVRMRKGVGAVVEDVMMGRTTGRKPNIIDRTAQRSSWFLQFLERELTMHAALSGYLRGKQEGLRGRKLLDFMDDTAQAVNSLYNNMDLPGVLTSTIGQAYPFQTFRFEALNNLLELMGRTGDYQRMSKGREMRAMKWMASIYVANQLGQLVRNQPSYDWLSFTPMSEPLLPIADEGYMQPGRGYPILGKATYDLYQAGKAAVVHDNWKPTRSWILRWGKVPAGVQVDKTIQAIEAAADRGRVRDVGGRELYRVPKEQQPWSYIIGPRSTKAAQESRKRAWEEAVPEALHPLFPMIPFARSFYDVLDQSKKPAREQRAPRASRDKR